MWLFISLLLIGTVTSAPAELKRACPEFDQPWILTDIEVFYPVKVTPGSGHVSFNFYDVNTNGLQMETQCLGIVTDYKCQAPDDGYVSCANATVAFKLEKSLLMVAREILDSCVGPPPQNYEQAFGQNNTEMTNTTFAAGTCLYMPEMLVEITQMA